MGHILDALFDLASDWLAIVLHRRIGTWGCLAVGAVLIAALIGLFALLLR
jgi:hypothetical protein